MITRTIPGPVSGLSNVIAIAAGDTHTVALKSDGTVWTWGDNSFGQLGDGTTTLRTTPVQVSGLGNVLAIAAGVWHTVALKSDGSVWVWGDNNSGQLGNGTADTSPHPTPNQASGLSSIIAIEAGEHHVVALKSDGTVWTWGNNGLGQLGDGTTTNRYHPSPGEQPE
jgi:alpha-tubulin suppressor-like RCC1 family protein